MEEAGFLVASQAVSTLLVLKEEGICQVWEGLELYMAV